MASARLLYSWRGIVTALTWILIGQHAWLGPNQGRCDPPKLLQITPPGAQRGTQVRAKCIGDFSWPTSVWAPGVDVQIGEELGQLEITVPQDLATDRVWIRLYNQEGCSAAVPWLIGNLKETNEQEPNDAPRSAQIVSNPPTTINGVLEKKGDVDAFAIELNAGQTIVAAVDAHSQIGSPMDAILQIVSPQGTVLTENHDAVGLDPRLIFTATTSGTFVVRVFAFPSEPDTRIEFRGGTTYVYRLTLTTGPFVTHSRPPSTAIHDHPAIGVIGWNIPPTTKLPVVRFEMPGVDMLREQNALSDVRLLADTQLGFVFSPEMAGAAHVRLVPFDVSSKFELAGSSEAPHTIPIPSTMLGLLREPDQSTTYEFALAQGQHILIAVEAPSLDWPTVPSLSLLDPARHIAAEVSNKGPQQDAILTYTAAQDGLYQLRVSDRFGRGGDRFFYQLTVRWNRPDFALSVDADSVVVRATEATELPISVQRWNVADQTVGPITVEAIELPDTVSSTPVISETTGPTADKVTLRLTSDGGVYAGPIRIRGTAAQPSQLIRFGQTPPKLNARFETIWLTAVAAPAAETTNTAAHPDSP